MGSSGMASGPGTWIGDGVAGAGGSHNKITKGRGRMVVKPILKKLSNSEKNSLDLDRGWEEQLHNWSGGASATASPAGGVSRSVRDVTFVPSSFADLGSSSSGGAGGSGAVASAGGASGVLTVGSVDVSSIRPKFQHARSPSGASHASVATTGSSTGGVRSGTFVHPFQQTPRTATPPLSYANSLASMADAAASGAGARDYSPTITENEDDDYAHSLRRPPSASHLAHSRSHSLSGPSGAVGAGSHPYPNLPHSMSQSSLRRPSLASQRTSSFSEANGSSATALSMMQPITSGSGGGAGAIGGGGTGGASVAGGRLNSNRSAGAAASSRLVHGGSMLSSSKSQSDLHLNLTLNTAATAPALADSASLSSSRAHFATNSPHNTTGRVSSIQSPSVANANAPASASSFGLSSPTSSFSATPMSPLRSSLELVTGGLAPRLRSLSEQPDRTKTMMDPVEHARLMREARAKFDEKERLKNEKLARKRGRALSKEAEKQQRDLEKQQRQARSLASSSSVDHLPRPSTAASTHNSIAGGDGWRRRYASPGSFMAPAGNAAGSPQQQQQQQNEKVTFAGYGGVPNAEGQGVADQNQQQQQQQQQRHRGSSSAKRRTHSYWTSVILWIRTKIFKLSRGD